MTIIYCETDPIGPNRWTGVNRLLTAYEVDYNFYQHETRIATLEGNAHTTVSIAYITLHGDQMTIHMTDHSTQGPFTIPLATFRDRGTWLASTAYSVNDLVSFNGALYIVLFDHVSGLTFDPNANDGLGHSYYGLLLSLPSNSLPTGGATGQMLVKSAGTDYAVTWAYPLPVGGSHYQVLMKNSGTNQDASWASLAALHVSYTPASGSAITATDVEDALNQIYSHFAVAISAFSSTLKGLADVSFPSGYPQQGSLMYFGGGFKWTATATPAGSNYIPVWNGFSWGTEASNAVPLSFTQMTDNLSVAQRIDSTLSNLGTNVSGAVSLDPSLALCYEITPNGNVTLNALNAGTQCQEITIIVLNFNTTTDYAITFGTHFDSIGPLPLTIVPSSGVQVIKFVSDGFTWHEVSRSPHGVVGRSPNSITGITGSGTQNLDANQNTCFKTVPGGALTINLSNAGAVGEEITLLVQTNVTISYVITFGTNIKSTGTLTTGTTASQTWVVKFVSDGTKLYEVSRSGPV